MAWLMGDDDDDDYDDGDDTNFGECVKIQYIIQYKIHLRYEVVCNKNIIFIYLR